MGAKATQTIVGAKVVAVAVEEKEVEEVAAVTVVDEINTTKKRQKNNR